MECCNCKLPLQKGVAFCPRCGASQVKENISDKNSYGSNKIGGTWSWKDKKFSILNHVLSVLVCILMIIVALMGTLSYSLAKSYSEDTFRNLFSVVKISDIDISEIAGVTKEITVVDVIYHDVIGEFNARRLGITKEGIEVFLDSKKVKDFYSKEISSYADYLINGEGRGIKAREIVKFIKDNEELFEDKFNYSLSDRDYDYMEDWINRELKEGGRLSALGGSAEDYLEEYSLDGLVSYIKTYSSLWIRIVAAILGLLFAGLIVFIDRKRCYIAFIYLSASNAILSLISFVIFVFKGSVAKSVAFDYGIDRDVIEDVLGIVLNGIKVSAELFLILSIVFAVAAIAIGFAVPLLKNRKTVQ